MAGDQNTRPEDGAVYTVPSRPRPLGKPRETSQVWMVTFTDLVALMLTFFVLLYSMSQMEEKQWRNIADSLAVNLNRVQETAVVAPVFTLDAPRVRKAPGENLDYLMVVLNDLMQSEPILARSLLAKKGDRIVISLPGDLLFTAGATQLGETGKAAVFALGGLLRSLRNAVEVAGHADPSLPQGFTDNWELSAMRALSVSQLLTQAGYPGNISVRGFGASRFSESTGELPENERNARARRVDIVIHEYASEAAE